MTIAQITQSGKIPYGLLLLSDETKEAIDKNLDKGELYIAEENEETVASFILKSTDSNTIEIKNIAVLENLQGKGIGTILLSYIKENAKKRGFKEVLVGTCDQCKNEIAFYKKAGFIITGVRHNFFLNNYKKAIFENGQQIIDLVLLKYCL